MEVVRMHNCEIWIPIERWVFVTYKFSWLREPQEKYSHQKSLQGYYQAAAGSLVHIILFMLQVGKIISYMQSCHPLLSIDFYTHLENDPSNK
jgi:hypothetical protein